MTAYTVPPQILNLGCGTRTSSATVNIDWSIYLRLKSNPLTAYVASLLLTGDRRTRFFALSDRIIVHDLRKGIPAGDGSVDAVYHSHVLEHLDRSLVPLFFAEIHRVLRPGGIHRVVVPDLEHLAQAYLRSLDGAVHDRRTADEHEFTVAAMIEQMVRREAVGTSRQRPSQRRLENILLGDARRRGETHQWMWDRVTVRRALEGARFHDVRLVDHRTSRIAGWDAIALDEDPDGSPYKSGSLYVEACRPTMSAAR